jgi:predicted  nucleic acid-binding Zn-ribbon protein
MFACKRCGSKFSSARAATIRDCPRCLLRDDVASPLTFSSDQSWGPVRPEGDPKRRTRVQETPKA